MIDADEPPTWRNLQDRVAAILREAGVVTAVEKVIPTARGEVSIDLWAHDPAATPSQTYLVECKRWRTRVPQAVVHAFRTVVGDSGANWGAIISAAGFQKGAYRAAEYSNVRLLSWVEFETLFVLRWFSRHFVRKINEITDPLVEYTEPINSRIFKKADLLDENRRQEFRRLREVHGALGYLCLMFGVGGSAAMRIVLGEEAELPIPPLPLRNTLSFSPLPNGMSLPVSILDATSYRSLLDAITSEAIAAISQFDDVFGERA